MIDIHCHTCGGFISDPRRVSHRLPADAAVLAAPRTGICTCGESVIFGPPAGNASSPGVAAVSRQR